MTISDLPPLYVTVPLVMLGIFLLTRLPIIGRLISAVIWAGATTLLVLVVTEQGRFHPEVAQLLERIGIEDRQQVSGEEVRIRMANDGHFWVRARIGGVERRMLVDSGATVTAISEATAAEAGVTVRKGITPVVLQTANGTAFASPATVERLRVAGIEARNLPVVVSPSFGDMDVLGMNFLSQLKSWRVEERTMILVPQPARTQG